MIDWAIFVLVLGVNSLFLTLVIFRGKKLRIRVAFSWIIGLAILWTISNFFADHIIDHNLSLLFTRLAYVVTALVPFALFNFVNLFPREIKKIRLFNKLFVFIPSVFVSLLSFTEYVVLDIQRESWGISIVEGKFSFVFTFYFIIFMIPPLVVLFRKYRHVGGVDKVQIQYLFLGFLFAAMGGALFNLILPTLTNNYVYTKYGPYFTIVLVSFTTYAIIKHRLLAIRFIVLRAISYSLLVVLIAATIVGLTLMLPQYFGFSLTMRTLIAIGTSIFLVLILDPVKRFIANITDQLFYKKRINYQKLLADLSNAVNREIDLSKLTGFVEDELRDKLKISRVVVYVAPTKKADFYIRDARPHQHDAIKRTSPLVQYLVQSRRVVVLEALERKIEDTSDQQVHAELEASKAVLDELDASIASPVFIEQNVNAIIILGHKLSGDPFGDEDINLLELLGPQLASAIVKSQLYDEIKQFNVKLQKEIDIATHDLQSANTQLQERNRFLSALQKVTTLMTQSLNLKKVTQDIVDAIAKEMGFLGGLLLFLGKDRRKLFPEAMTQNKYSAKIAKLLPKPMSEYYGHFDKDDTKAIRAIKSGKVEIGEHLHEYISPPVPKLVCDAIQKALGITTVIAVPIQSEGEYVGAIVYVLDTDPGTLNETDLEMMRALANQTGIMYKNIELYRQLEDSNKDLGVANEHLKELDQAKSEFVSIASHQLRTPMTGIMGYLSMLVGGDFGKIKKDQLVIMQNLLDESRRMINLIRVFLDVSKIESGKLSLKKAPGKIEDVITKCVTVITKAASDKGLKLTFVKPKTAMPKILIDADKMSDVVTNLIDNAIKYTDKGSITITTKLEGDHVHVMVTDTGIGIEPHDAKNLFNKFVRGYGIAQINPDGSGLGLYVARRLTEAHGGKIWVESKGKGKGSTFQFTLPLNPPEGSHEMHVHDRDHDQLEYVRKNR